MFALTSPARVLLSGTGGYAVVKLALWKELPERYADLAPEGKVAVKVVSKASIEVCHRRIFLLSSFFLERERLKNLHMVCGFEQDKEKYLRILIA